MGKDLLHTWLQQILHNCRCVNILKRHMSSANLMKTFVNPNINVFSYHMHRQSQNQKKNLSLSLSPPPPPHPPPPKITATLLFDEEKCRFDPKRLLIRLATNEVSDLYNEADDIIVGALSGFSNSLILELRQAPTRIL